MSFASSQHLSPAYKNISASGTITASGSITSSENITALGSITSSANLNVSGTSNLGAVAINTSQGQTSNGLSVNNVNPSSGTSTNSLTLTTGNYGLELLSQLVQGQGASFSLGTGDLNDGFETIMSGNAETLTIASTNVGVNNLTAQNASFTSGLTVDQATITEATITNLTTGLSGIDFSTPNISISVNSGSNMLFTTFEGAGFYFDQPVYATGGVSADTMEVGLTTSAHPTHPTTSQHIGFVMKESFQNESVVANVANSLLTFTLPKGTFMINGVLQLDVPSSTTFNSAVISQTLGSTVVSSFTSTQLVPNNSPNDINVNIPIMNTIFNSAEQSFTISILAQYTSASYVNVTSNSYLVCTRVT
jgi:hypothetical protein